MHFLINLFDSVQVFVMEMIFGITNFKFFIDVIGMTYKEIRFYTILAGEMSRCDD